MNILPTTNNNPINDGIELLFLAAFYESKKRYEKKKDIITEYCLCNRCDGNCNGKVQKGRIVCARCRDRRCLCKVCGQKRSKISKNHPQYVEPCNCTKSLKKKEVNLTCWNIEKKIK